MSNQTAENKPEELIIKLPNLKLSSFITTDEDETKLSDSCSAPTEAI